MYAPRQNIEKGNIVYNLFTEDLIANIYSTVFESMAIPIKHNNDLYFLNSYPYFDISSLLLVLNPFFNTINDNRHQPENTSVRISITIFLLLTSPL